MYEKLTLITILADVQEQNIVVLLVVACHLDFIFITYGTTGKQFLIKTFEV